MYGYYDSNPINNSQSVPTLCGHMASMISQYENGFMTKAEMIQMVAMAWVWLSEATTAGLSSEAMALYQSLISQLSFPGGADVPLAVVSGFEDETLQKGFGDFYRYLTEEQLAYLSEHLDAMIAAWKGATAKALCAQAHGFSLPYTGVPLGTGSGQIGGNEGGSMVGGMGGLCFYFEHPNTIIPEGLLSSIESALADANLMKLPDLVIKLNELRVLLHVAMEADQVFNNAELEAKLQAIRPMICDLAENPLPKDYSVPPLPERPEQKLEHEVKEPKKKTPVALIALIAVVGLIAMIAVGGIAAVLAGGLKLPDFITDGSAEPPIEASTEPLEGEPALVSATHTPAPDDQPTPTATTVLTGQEAVPQNPTPAPDQCAERGGTTYAGDLCTCQGVIDRVVICGDGTKFDNMTTTACTPNPADCQGSGDSGGQQTCTLTVADCNTQGFSSVDPVTCTCFGNYKP